MVLKEIMSGRAVSCPAVVFSNEFGFPPSATLKFVWKILARQTDEFLYPRQGVWGEPTKMKGNFLVLLHAYYIEIIQ